MSSHSYSRTGLLQMVHGTAVRRSSCGAPLRWSDLKTRDRLPTEPLTSREQELLVLLDWGCSSQEIAAELRTNVYAVQHRISILCQKFQAKTRRDAVLAARARGLVS